MLRHEPLALAHQTGVRLAEIGFLLVLFAGVWLPPRQVPNSNLVPLERSSQASRSPLAGLLLIIATHWGHFG